MNYIFLTENLYSIVQATNIRMDQTIDSLMREITDTIVLTRILALNNYSIPAIYEKETKRWLRGLPRSDPDKTKFEVFGNTVYVIVSGNTYNKDLKGMRIMQSIYSKMFNVNRCVTTDMILSSENHAYKWRFKIIRNATLRGKNDAEVMSVEKVP